MIPPWGLENAVAPPVGVRAVPQPLSILEHTATEKALGSRPEKN